MNFYFLCTANIFFAFLEDKDYKKEYDRVFAEMLKNGKLDKIIMVAQDKSSNPFLTLPYRKVYGTAYVFSFLEKNYPLLFKICVTIT